ncbi:FCD domain-containing protein [Pendulispora rubella]|uniref:FCD domain-containing protein n=1 Tax=Pendulispora rubella TaxID=2741070 RepID=A0ABZ2KYM1_9BACT
MQRATNRTDHEHRRATQADHAFTLIRNDILSCRVKPGAKLKIAELCERYDFSLGSVREALSRLTGDGLVVAEPQKGYSVAPVSRDELVDLTRARVELEALCMADSIRNGDLRWESALLATLHRLRHLPERDPEDTSRLDDQWSTAHQEFHAALVSGCTNRWLLRMRAILYAQSERYRRLSVPLRTEPRDVNAEHHEMVKAALARDVAQARRLIEIHFETTTRLILQGLDLTDDNATRHEIE